MTLGEGQGYRSRSLITSQFSTKCNKLSLGSSLLYKIPRGIPNLQVPVAESDFVFRPGANPDIAGLSQWVVFKDYFKIFSPLSSSIFWQTVPKILYFFFRKTIQIILSCTEICRFQSERTESKLKSLNLADLILCDVSDSLGSHRLFSK